jgi:hypothetical protein
MDRIEGHRLSLFAHTLARLRNRLSKAGLEDRNYRKAGYGDARMTAIKSQVGRMSRLNVFFAFRRSMPTDANWAFDLKQLF